MPTEDVLDRYYRSVEYESLEGSELTSGVGVWDLGPARAAAQVRMVTRWTARRGAWLDVGAGYGFLLDAAQRAGWSTAGIEPGPMRGEEIAQRGHTLYESLDLVGGLWDVISLSHCLEHVVDPVSFLRQLRPLLAPGGLILCEVPNDGPGATSGRDVDEPHVVFFSQVGLSRCAAHAGLQQMLTTTAGPSRIRPRLSFSGAFNRLADNKLARPLLPTSMLDSFHYAFLEGVDRIWIRALLSVPAG
jgi:SAM-dependent methyltransferase